MTDKTITREAETAHGRIEYETVKCDSCGNEVLPDDTVDFKIGSREGVACEHCHEEGPLSFPDIESTTADILFASIIVPVIAVAIVTKAADTTEEDVWIVRIYLGGLLSGVLVTAGFFLTHFGVIP